MGLIFIHILQWLQKMHLFCNTVRNGGSRSSKVDDFGTNRKRICIFLLVRHSNRGLACTVSEIRRLIGRKLQILLPLFYSVAHYILHVVNSLWNFAVKLTVKKLVMGLSSLKTTIVAWVILTQCQHVIRTDTQTDGQTVSDGRMDRRIYYS